MCAPFHYPVVVVDVCCNCMEKNQVVSMPLQVVDEFIYAVCVEHHSVAYLVRQGRRAIVRSGERKDTTCSPPAADPPPPPPPLTTAPPKLLASSAPLSFMCTASCSSAKHTFTWTLI